MTPFRPVITLIVLSLALTIPESRALASGHAAEQTTEPAEMSLSLPAAPGAYPVHYEGRVMPLESAADIVLYRFSARRRVDGRSSTEWLLRLLAEPFSAAEDPVFLVDDPAVLEAIGLPSRERGRYSYAELYPHLTQLNMLGVSLSSLERELDATEQGIVLLSNNVRLFEGIASTLDVFRASDSRSGFAELLAGDTPAPEELIVVPGMLRVIPYPSADGLE